MKKVNLREMLIQVLENQCAMLLVDIKREYQGSVTHKHLSKVRKNTVEILEKVRKKKDTDR